MQLENTIGGICSDRLRMSALEINWYMRNQLLRDSDWAGMAHSLEIRVPLVDLNLLRDRRPTLPKYLHGKDELARTGGQADAAADLAPKEDRVCHSGGALDTRWKATGAGSWASRLGVAVESEFFWHSCGCRMRVNSFHRLPAT